MRRNLFPLIVVFAWLAAMMIPLLVNLQPDKIDLQGMLSGPGSHHLLGQDELGRPVLHRLIAGAQTSLLVSVSVTFIVALTGIIIGAVAAWVGGWFEHLVVRLIDLFMAFPGILLAIALAGILGPGISNLVIALSIVGWVGFARLTRAQVLVLKHRDHIQAAQALGTPAPTIVFQHLLPLISAPLVVEATFTIASVIIAEAGLSFLGIGIQPPEASWGNMIKEGSRYLLVAPHLVLAPGLALALVVLSINRLGDQLRDHLDCKASFNVIGSKKNVR